MAVELEISYLDVNGESATNSVSIDAAANAAATVQLFKNTSNCRVVKASIITPVDISGLTGNTSAAANVESAKFKMAVSLSGPIPSGATQRPRVTFQIPAPLGTLINGRSGDPANAAFTAFLAHVVSNRGEVLDTVDSVNYVR